MRGEREVLVVPRGGDSSARWFLWGALAGAVVALLYTPNTGEQTRRGLTRRLRKLRAMTEEKVDDLFQSLGNGSDAGAASESEEWEDEYGDEEYDDAVSADLPAEAEAPMRVELEERLKEARARRRTRRKEEAAD